MLPKDHEEYIANSYIELYKYMGLPMIFIPFDHAAGKDKNGRPIIRFREDLALEISGSFEEAEQDNPDVDIKGAIRADARIRIVMKTIRDVGMKIAERDAIDVVMPEGKKRYIITGFDTPPSPSYIFSLPKVTELEKAFKQ